MKSKVYTLKVYYRYKGKKFLQRYDKEIKAKDFMSAYKYGLDFVKGLTEHIYLEVDKITLK